MYMETKGIEEMTREELIELVSSLNKDLERMECSAHSRKCVCRIVTGSVHIQLNIISLWRKKWKLCLV